MLNHTHIKLLFKLVAPDATGSEGLVYAYYHTKPSIYQACTVRAAIDEAHYDLATDDSSTSWHILSKLILILNHKDPK